MQVPEHAPNTSPKPGDGPKGPGDSPKAQGPEPGKPPLRAFEHDDGFILGAALEPILHDACSGRLGPVRWFRTTWQRGGATTGEAEWTLPDGRTTAALIKLPVGAKEYRWTRALGHLHDQPGDCGELDAPTPRVLAGDEVLGGYDLAWLVLEKYEGAPVTRELNREGLLGLLRVAAGFQAHARNAGVEIGPAKRCDWPALFEKSAQRVEAGELAISPAEERRWLDALAWMRRVSPQILDRWRSRRLDDWCHGDLHPGNVIRRADGRFVLIDLALVHRGHWLEDALYIERLFWGREDRLEGVNPVHQLAEYRQRLGLPGMDSRTELMAAHRRVLAAAAVPVFLGRFGDRRYVHAALERLEGLLPVLTDPALRIG